MRSLLVARPTLAAGGGAVGSLGGVLGSLGGAGGSLGGIVGSVGGVVGSVGGVVVGSLGGMVGSVGTGWPGVVLSSPAGGVSCASAGNLIAAAPIKSLLFNTDNHLILRSRSILQSDAAPVYGKGTG